MKSLRKKPTFNELINYIEVEQPKIKYPDRTATFLRNTHYLSQFDRRAREANHKRTNKRKRNSKGSSNHTRDSIISTK
jgi:hypothetical protein